MHDLTIAAVAATGIDSGDSAWLLVSTALVLMMTPALGLFAQKSWNDIADGALFGDVAQLGRQAIAVVAAPTFAFAGTFVLLRLIGLVTPLRVSRRDEGLGLDVTQHGEEAYTRGEGAILVTEAAPGVELAAAQPSRVPG